MVLQGGLSQGGAEVLQAVAGLQAGALAGEAGQLVHWQINLVAKEWRNGIAGTVGVLWWAGVWQGELHSPSLPQSTATLRTGNPTPRVPGASHTPLAFRLRFCSVLERTTLGGSQVSASVAVFPAHSKSSTASRSVAPGTGPPGEARVSFV